MTDSSVADPSITSTATTTITPTSTPTATLDLTKTFLSMLLLQSPDHESARILLDKFDRKDPSAIDYLKTLKTDPYLAPYHQTEVIETLRHELGFSVESEEECITALEYYKEILTDPASRDVLEKALEFIQIPEGEELDWDNLPFAGLVELIEQCPNNREYLEEAIRYLGTMIDV